MSDSDFSFYQRGVYPCVSQMQASPLAFKEAERTPADLCFCFNAFASIPAQTEGFTRNP